MEHHLVSRLVSVVSEIKNNCKVVPILLQSGDIAVFVALYDLSSLAGDEFGLSSGGLSSGRDRLRMSIGHILVEIVKRTESDHNANYSEHRQDDLAGPIKSFEAWVALVVGLLLESILLAKDSGFSTSFSVKRLRLRYSFFGLGVLRYW